MTPNTIAAHFEKQSSGCFKHIMILAEYRLVKQEKWAVKYVS